MESALSMEMTLMLIGGFLILSVIASKLSAKLGIPALLLFLGLGMLAGSDGPGGIPFSDFELAKSFGTVALALILFSGGLETEWSEVRGVVWPVLSLATLGVAITAGLVGMFAYYLLDLPLLTCLLLGAVVSSTDAAAVFGVLRSRNINLKHRLRPTLEAESGSNDPMAVFLTTALITLAADPESSIMGQVLRLIVQFPLGILVGVAGGLATVFMINRLRLEYDGLYPVLTLAGAALTFGGATLVGGNEFLAIYVAGLVMGSHNFLHKLALVQFHEGVAWLMQIAMFLMLGMLAFPSQLIPLIPVGLLLSFGLIFVARPIAVFFSLLFASRMRRRDRLFVSWAGLRGAVPIILATFPIVAGIEGAQTVFNIVFFIVLTSVAIQGTLIGSVSRALGVIAPERETVPYAPPAGGGNVMEIVVREGSRVAWKPVVEMNLPKTCLLLMLKRGEQSYIPRGGTILQPGDVVLVATRKNDSDELRALFGDEPESIAIVAEA